MNVDGKARLRIDGETYNDPFDAVLAAMKSPKSMEAHAKSYRAAIEAAALFHSNMIETAAKRINERLAEVGGAKKNYLSLVKQIREIAGAATAGKQFDAHAAAEKFLAHRAEVGKVDDGQPILRYYQTDFYARSHNAWNRLEDKNFEAQVMEFLQTLEIPKLTERFAKDVVAYLRGLTNLKCWDEPMPFLVVKEAPLEIKRPRLIVFQNGMIDLDQAIAGTVKKPSKINSAYFNETALPYAFDFTAKCPLWIETLKGVLPKTGDGDNRQLVLQEAFGYTLLPDCRFEKCFILLGPGGNGKSTVSRVWQAMLGTANVSNVALEDLGGEYRLEALRGKLANFSGEFPFLGKVHEGMLKQLVSGEDRDVNRKYKPPIKVRLYAKLVCSTNQVPQINDPTEATFDRLVIMPFEVRLRGKKKEDKTRAATLIETELSGIFLWVLAGLKRLLKQGGFTKCSTLPGTRERASYLQRSRAGVREGVLPNGFQEEHAVVALVRGLQGVCRDHRAQAGVRFRVRQAAEGHGLDERPRQRREAFPDVPGGQAVAVGARICQAVGEEGEARSEFHPLGCGRWRIA